MLIIIIAVIVVVIIARRTAMKIYVLSNEHERIVLNVEASDAVFDVKFKIQEANGIPIANQQLNFKGRILLDADPLSLYKIKKIVSYG